MQPRHTVRVRAVQTIPKSLRRVPWARLLVLGELQYPDPEELIRAGIPLLRKVPHKFHRAVAKFKADVESLLVWTGPGSGPLQNRTGDLAAIWPTLFLGAVKGEEDLPDQSHGRPKRPSRHHQMEEVLDRCLGLAHSAAFMELW